MLDHGTVDSETYEKIILDVLDCIGEMKLSGDYDTDTLDELIWRLS